MGSLWLEILDLDPAVNHEMQLGGRNMRFVTGLMLGIALGLSLGLLAAPQRGSETIQFIRERASRWHETDADEDDSASV